MLIQYFIVLWLSATNDHNAFRHSQKRIHGWRVAVELVQNNITFVHYVLVFGKRHPFRDSQFHPVGILFGYGRFVSLTISPQ